jgi:hypothetical protein
VLQLGIDSEYSTFFIGLICDDTDATHSYWLRLLRLVRRAIQCARRNLEHYC